MGNPYAPPSGERTRADAPTPTQDQRSGPQSPPPPPPRPTPVVPPPTPRPPADPELERATSRRVLHFAGLLLGAVLASMLPLPGRALGIVLVLAALVVGVRALVLAWRGGVPGGVVPMLGVGVVSAAFVALFMLVMLSFWPQEMARQTCLRDAVTIAATERCEADYRRAFDERLPGGTPASP